MLKEQMIKKMSLLEEMVAKKDKLLNEQVKTIREQDKAIECLQETTSEFKRLQKHVSDSLVAIDAIADINCRENVEFRRNGHMIIEDAKREGKDPEWPEVTPLFSALMHIESILCRRIAKEESGYDRFIR